MAAAPLPFPAQLRSQLRPQLGDYLGWRKQIQTEALSSEIEAFDAFSGGCPRGSITEIIGAASSGRTSIVHRVLAAAAERREYCAIVDVTNSFDPLTASRAGVDLDGLLWVKCGNHLEHAMKSADLLIHSGGFGVVVLDLCGVPAAMARRIPLSWWYRFQRALEKTETILLIPCDQSHAKACASLMVEVQRQAEPFVGSRKLLQAHRYRVQPRKPYLVSAAAGEFAARA